MKSRILGIQFRKNADSLAQEQKCIERALQECATVEFISSLDESLDWSSPQTLLGGVDGVVLGGSGDFDFDGGRSVDDPNRTMSFSLLERLRPLFEYIFTHDIPTLGICYGHQLIGAFAGVRVWNDPDQKKSCSHEVRLLASAHDTVLFSGLSDSFSPIYGHKDSLERVPEDAVLLVEGGEKCKVSALRYKNNIFTTQFHPELTFADIVERLKSSPNYLPEGVTVDEVFKDDADAIRILTNFGAFVALQKTTHLQ